MVHNKTHSPHRSYQSDQDELFFDRVTKHHAAAAPPPASFNAALMPLTSSVAGQYSYHVMMRSMHHAHLLP
jgi:hypothetical protein